MKYKITAEKTTFYYYLDFQYEDIPKVDRIITTDALDYINKTDLESISRVVLTEEPRTKKFIIDYLVWLNNVDLKDIDKKICNNNYNDADFYYAIKTYFIKNLHCFDCNHTFLGGLAVDAVQIYPDNFPLGRKKIELVRNSGKLLQCPSCGGSFRNMVLHVFE